MAYSRPRDRGLEGGLDTDLVIPVMGPTKAGKSSLLNQLLGSATCEVGVKLVSCTALVNAHIASQPPPYFKGNLRGRRIVFVDTPGFDDTYIGDEEILSRISDWLAKSFKERKLVSGILYLHDISRDGFTESLSRNLTMLSKLCGEDAMHHVAIVTTKWDRLHDAKEGADKVEELRNDFWRKILAEGARTYDVQPPASDDGIQLYPGHRKPWDIVHELILAADTRDTQARILQIQDEIVNRRLLLPETAAGKELQMSLGDLLKKAKDLRRRVKEDSKAGRPTESLEMRQLEIERIIGQLKALKPGLVARAKRLFLF